MRLLTHNLLMCNRKQCGGGFPLKIVLTENVQELVQEEDFNPDFVRNVLEKLDWDALCSTAKSLQLEKQLPPSYTEADKQDDSFLKAVHHLVLEVHIKEATLVCPKCEREYPVSKGIPNMLLNSDEV
eukprot:GHVS01064501.1.p1 GENE.GHVS01064501.1~~GHVS01064501.1.p1  ORF type:complete len:127 (+),score=20.77 GHVS01064501.1:110-490(+)